MTSSAIVSKGFERGEVISVLAENVPALYELHFSVPMSWCVLSAINYRLDAATVAYELEHSESKLIFADVAFFGLVKESLSLLNRKIDVIWITDQEIECELPPSDETYEDFIRSGSPSDPVPVHDENSAISINYTSWTTGKPKGVVYTHRGAYVNAMGNAIAWNMGNFPVFLWTLPMFHCNGWCFPWTLAVVAWTSVCMRKMNAKNVYSAISEWKVTHFCWAPIVANTLLNASEDEKRPFSHRVSLMLAAAPPPLATIRAMEKMGVTITHAYGLTETYGPAACCAWHPEWDWLSEEERWRHAANAWVPYQILDGLEVMNVATGEILPHDGKSEGEIVFRWNVVMKEYLKDESATAKAFEHWWFHTWDVWKIHPNGYLQVSDRLKDVIISWGENIASIEVENALCLHPSVKEAAVVAKADEKWWEVPCAFVSLKDGHSVTENELVSFCREKIAHYKIPKYVVFGPIERTSTWKTQKFVLRKKAEALPSKTARS